MENIEQRQKSRYRTWSDLPFDILVLVAKKNQHIKDFVAFGVVCVSWRSAAAKENFKGICPFPWLLQAKNFFGIEKHVISDTSGYIIDILPENIESYCLGWKGWFLVVEKNDEMSLIHVLSRTRISLPNKKSLRLYNNHVFKAALSSNPFTTPFDYTLVVIYGTDHVVAYWRPGDKSFTWTRIYNVDDVIFYNGLLHAIGHDGTTTVCDVNDPTATRKAEYTRLNGRPNRGSRRWYLVESAGELLRVERVFGNVKEFRIYVHEWQSEIKDVGNGETFADYNASFSSDVSEMSRCWREIKDVGHRAIFVGLNASFSVDISHLSRCMANHIYFTDDTLSFVKGDPYKGHHHMGVYSLMDARVVYSHCGKKETCDCSSPPLWVTPTFF